MARPTSFLLSALVGTLGWSHCSLAQPIEPEAEAAPPVSERPPTASFEPATNESGAPVKGTAPQQTGSPDQGPAPDDQVPDDQVPAAPAASGEPDAHESDFAEEEEEADGTSGVEIDTSATEGTAIRRIPRQTQNLSALGTRRTLVLRTLISVNIHRRQSRLGPGSEFHVSTSRG